MFCFLNYAKEDVLFHMTVNRFMQTNQPFFVCLLYFNNNILCPLLLRRRSAFVIIFPWAGTYEKPYLIPGPELDTCDRNSEVLSCPLVWMCFYCRGFPRHPEGGGLSIRQKGGNIRHKAVLWNRHPFLSLECLHSKIGIHNSAPMKLVQSTAHIWKY